jgi:hypothetical protein
MKPLHDGRQHGFLQREAEQHVSSNTDVADVFVATSRVASGRVLERHFARPLAKWREPVRQRVGRVEPGRTGNALQVAGAATGGSATGPAGSCRWQAPRWCRRWHCGGRRRGIPAACPRTHALVADGAARASWSNRWDFSATRASFAPVKLESLTGIVGSRANSSNAMLYAVERGAGVGVLPTCSIGFGRTVGRVR